MKEKEIYSFVLDTTHLFKEREKLGFYIDRGWGNGYVAVPKEHPWHAKDYHEIHENFDVIVHGGLTFSGDVKRLRWVPEHIPKDFWIVGFDTAHYMDSIRNWPKESVERETEYLRKQAISCYNG